MKLILLFVGQKRAQIFSVLSFLFLTGWVIPHVVAADSDSTIIEQTYKAWVYAANAKDIELWSAFLSSDAAFLPPEHQALETTDEIIDFYLKLFADDQFSLDCRQTAVAVALSGELAWARGWCTATFSGPDGHAVSGRRSDWTKVWIKDGHGTWKCRLNTWNYDSP